METHTFFIQLLVILLTARLLAEIAVRINIPAVIGELLAGIILGPSLLGYLQPNEVIRLLAEIGIILLLFSVGLETDVRRIIRTGQKSFIVALMGFFAPFMLGFMASYWLFELSLLVSLFIGGTLTATSIGITVRVLSDVNRQNEPEGQIVLGAAVLDDLLGVVLLALLYEFSIGGGVSLLNASKVLVFLTLFFLLAPIAARLISVVIRHFEQVKQLPGLIPTAIVSLVLFFAWLAHAVGAPELLGGFAAGLALSRRFFLPFGIALHTDHVFSQRISDQMRPIIQLFTPIFFVMIGLSLNLREIDWSSSYIWSFSLVFFVIAVVGKFTGAILIKEIWPKRILIGLSMMPRGEVGLIFAELGHISGIFNNEIHAGMIIVIALTTLLAPVSIRGFYCRNRERFD
ncbi:MAG: cation:proton antiporter [Gammaproteobacteria bacterium]|nr:cation:proton antiporter [Gammaproteobacteria bacterium]MCW8909144.1 cation:proton antiporter [Gammaproteobacteria bacterium]MCW9006228.1 cation:proton antiporter [Gammaproteobacteria bacterium]MCW9057147.1 cation:proton antiporter [Gammaproteobacteria bacterium]